MKSRVRCASIWIQRIGFHGLADVIGVVAEEPDGRQEFQGRPPARHPCAELPDDGKADAAVPAVLPDVQWLAAVVFTDRDGEIGQHVEREARLVTHHVRDGLLRLRTDQVDVELDSRVAKAARRLLGRPASRADDVARESPHRHQDRRPWPSDRTA